MQRLRGDVRLTLLTVAMVLLAIAPATAQSAQDLDATKADAAHHKVVFENDQVRVVRYTIPPHVTTALHSHPALVSVLLTDAEAKITTPDGKVSDVHGKSGSAVWRGPTVHKYENVGDRPIEGILVEPKKPHSALPAGAQDAVTAEAHTKVEFENDQVRVLRYHVEPGEKSKMHGHPDNVQIVLADTDASVTTPDGKTTPSHAKAGNVVWRPATRHMVENSGSKAFEGILVEMKGTAANTTASK